MAGISTSQRTLAGTFGDRVKPTVYLFSLRPGVDADATAHDLESAFLANGMQADSLSSLLADAVAGSLTFDRLIMGFMGLGLIVGVTALGVITARSVVERRQQIGVLRAIGYRRRMVQISFLMESSFIALTAIVLGTILGLAVSFNVIHDSQQQPSWANLSFDPPWLTMGLIFLVGLCRCHGHDVSPGRARGEGLSRRGAALPVADRACRAEESGILRGGMGRVGDSMARVGVVLVAVMVASCGGEGAADAPTLPHALGASLAAQAGAVEVEPRRVATPVPPPLR